MHEHNNKESDFSGQGRVGGGREKDSRKAHVVVDRVCMSTTTKNPISLARAALEAGEKAFAPYSHPKSPHKFTQPQIFALLVLRQYFRLDYRGLIEWVRQWPTLQGALQLARVPHYSTLCYAERRLLKKTAVPESLTPPSPSPAGVA